jgi:NADH:ubiquinone oxidoreductase subunit 3 (subunit A)
MESILLIPPIAFVLYLILVTVLSRVGRLLAGPGHASDIKSSTYSSGELNPASTAVPGYKPFFMVALFFAILHLGVLVLGSGGLTPIMGLYLAGLILVLVILILG